MDLTRLSFIDLQGLSAELLLFSRVSFPLSSLNKTAKRTEPQKISLKVGFLFVFWRFLWIISRKTELWEGWHNNVYLIAFFNVNTSCLLSKETFNLPTELVGWCCEMIQCAVVWLRWCGLANDACVTSSIPLSRLHIIEASNDAVSIAVFSQGRQQRQRLFKKVWMRK